ncbi:ribonuclease H-like domain-containing protein [Chloroflexus sp.]|uniref:ribonuclease H-like domain-containing protein n=1 Tax=Chloroflexus sp. TaxID=1904827 RepID=UPI00260C711E|nr:ribonuclease H-like domain-containing protein [uncultured Chloroflexus sp.]
MRAYLDIETTYSGTISVLGIYRHDYGSIQLVGGGICDLALYDALSGITTIVTFNGSSFDLPVIRRRLHVDLLAEFAHRDLLRDCRRRGLRGGLKVVEETLGIARASTGLSGRDAPQLWERYEQYGDQAALQILLDYNRDDIVNLALLEAILDADHPLPANPARLVKLQ